ncbi:sulfurtransferase [Pelistega europaea]|uniref:Sulfurtransferase n=1 Tax=Pelistega europaea TaxID=106147 RepID=A0A7Y4L9J4_9BURK|nr:sulfurtransferase [Pelistega europaea]NOL49495.1 sulfurtransferase [Pelistega europaea]
MSKVLINAAELLATPSVSRQFIDVRHDLGNHQLGAQQYAEGHIPGAVFFDHETDLCSPKTGTNGRHPLPNRGDFAALLAKRGIDIAKETVVYDADSMMFAAHMWWMLRWVGFTNVRVLNGGIKAWKAAGGSIESGVAAPLPAVSWTMPASPMRVFTADQVLANITDPQFTLIDARAPERYRGDVEPMDPVAGHIPGAINHPFAQNLNAEGLMKSPEELREIFAQYNQHSLIVHQCGSGVTACHNILAMEEAGLHNYALYAGSWSEWVADASHPVATGAA